MIWRMALAAQGLGNRIEFNAVRDNGNLGIDLLDDGITANDAGDGDSGPNNLQNKPEIISIANPMHDSLHVTYRVDTNLGNASFPLSVDHKQIKGLEFFAAKYFFGAF
jgi:hypothetical protein